MQTQETKKQQQLGVLLYEELMPILKSLHLNMINNQLVSVSYIKVSPDLIEAKIFVSIFPFKDTDDIIKKLEETTWEVKKKLAVVIKNKVRRMPNIQFCLDDSLDHMYKIEALFKEIKK